LNILLQVELARVGPVARVPAQPHDDDALDDARLGQDGRCHVGDRADGDDVQWRIGGHRPLDQVQRRVAAVGMIPIRQKAGRSAKREPVGRDVEPV